MFEIFVSCPTNRVSLRRAGGLALPLLSIASRIVASIGMLGAQHLLVNRQRALKEGPRPRKVAVVSEQAGEVVEARPRIGMLGAESPLADGQRALVERPRPHNVALVLEQAGEVVEAGRGSGMLGPQRFFTHGKRALVERPSGLNERN